MKCAAERKHLLGKSSKFISFSISVVKNFVSWESSFYAQGLP